MIPTLHLFRPCLRLPTLRPLLTPPSHNAPSLTPPLHTPPPLPPPPQTPPPNNLPVLTASPQDGLMHQQVTIQASGLPPSTMVTLHTALVREEDRINFTSTNRYLTSAHGELNTAEQAPEEGSYTGVHRSGPLWSLSSSPGSVTRLWPADISLSMLYSLMLTQTATEQRLCSTHITRSYQGPGVKRVEVREDGVTGTLFLPALAGPAPAIITLYGGVNRGLVPEDRAAMLASQGYVSLALAYFGVGDLPQVYSVIDVEYFEAALDWLLARPEVAGDSLGLCGISKGGDISLAMAQFLGSKVAAVCVQGASYFSAPDIIKYKDQVIEKSDFTLEVSAPFEPVGGLEELKKHPERQIQFERSSAPVLGMVGEEDRALGEVARWAFQRAEKAGKTNCRLVEFPGAGHLIDLPHSPLCQEARHPLLPPHMKCWYGGQPQPHALAQIQAWTLLTGFFKDHLGPGEASGG